MRSWGWHPRAKWDVGSPLTRGICPFLPFVGSLTRARAQEDFGSGERKANESRGSRGRSPLRPEGCGGEADPLPARAASTTASASTASTPTSTASTSATLDLDVDLDGLGLDLDDLDLDDLDLDPRHWRDMMRGLRPRTHKGAAAASPPPPPCGFHVSSRTRDEVEIVEVDVVVVKAEAVEVDVEAEVAEVEAVEVEVEAIEGWKW